MLKFLQWHPKDDDGLLSALRTDLNQTPRLSTRATYWAQLASAGFLIPASFNSQGLISFWTITVICVLSVYPKQRLPFLKYFLLSLSAVAIYATEPRTVSAIFTALLLHVSALKLLELSTTRDAHFMLYAAIFSAFTGTLVGNTEWLYLILVPQFILGLIALSHVHQTSLSLNSFNFRVLISYLPIIAVGLVVLGILFFLFPRIGGGFLDIGLGSEKQIGLSDELSPGDLSRLSENDEIVFRVTGDLEPNTYWRAFALDDYQNNQWKQSTRRKVRELSGAPNELNNDESVLMLEMESSLQGFIPRLEWSIMDAGQGLVNQTQTIDPSIRQYLTVSITPTERRSVSDGDTGFIDAQWLTESSRLDAWLTRIDQEPFEQQLEALAKHFRETKTYTLTPERQQASNLDDLFFEVDEGYCGYFAGTTALLLAKLGYPTRVVVGFFGGERRDKTTVFRNRDAHAWVDVHDGFEWVSIDPTAWVTQQRLDNVFEVDAERAFSARAQIFYDRQSEIRQIFDGIPWLTSLKYQIDELGYLFTKYVVYFNREKQRTLIDAMSRHIGILLTILSIIIGILLILKRQQEPRRDRWLRRFDHAISKLTHHKRLPGQLPLAVIHHSDVGVKSAVVEFQKAWLKHKTGEGSERAMASSLLEIQTLGHKLKH